MTDGRHDDHWFEGKRVTVMGLGRFGGGSGVARWLAARGAQVLVTDVEPAEKLAAAVQGLDDLASRGVVEFRLGGHNVSDFSTPDLVVANPAVPKPWDNRFLRAAAAAGVPVTTEIRLAAERLDRARVIGVTGSAGKSTTSAMIAAGLRGCGVRAHLGGNIGGSLLPILPEIGPDDWVVLELSSFMLYWLGEGSGDSPWSPGVGVVTNITDNHLDWHGEMDHYAGCKLGIWRRQGPGDAAVLPADPAVAGPLADRMLAAARATGARVVTATRGDFPLRVPGSHNRMNAGMALAAIGAALRDRFDAHAAREAIASFEGLPHRLQLAAEGRGVRWYNDSKATTPESALLAVDAVAEGGHARVHLIAGGYDKKSDLSLLARLGSTLGGLYTIGVTGPAIAASAGGTAIECGTLARAVAAARARVKPGDVVLLSPGCASWDQFENYERRGEEFCRLAREAAR
jgi:UDP-N-acetylmuramoylalanine--D-glutamate ligase